MKKTVVGRKARANLLLLLTALIWGVAFVAQDVAMESMPPFTFGALRLALAGLALMPCIALLNRMGQKRSSASETERKNLRTMTREERRSLLTAGVCCGIALFLGTSFQQLGIQHTSAGKAGFVTTLYIVLVPVAGLFLGKRVRLHVWLAVLISLAGLFFLCVTEALTIGIGEIYLVVNALCFTVHILLVDYFAPRTDCLRMSCIQFLVAALLCSVAMILLETPTLAGIRAGIIPILYAGVLSGAVGYTLQILAQCDTDPTVASLLMCLESVFAVLAGWVILNQALSPRELLGCAGMLIGIVLAQVPAPRRT